MAKIDMQIGVGPEGQIQEIGFKDPLSPEQKTKIRNNPTFMELDLEGKVIFDRAPYIGTPYTAVNVEEVVARADASRVEVRHENIINIAGFMRDALADDGTEVDLDLTPREIDGTHLLFDGISKAVHELP